MLKVVYSNDMLQLAAHLAERQKAEPLPPLEAETVIVQSNELTRWLSLYLAQHHSIASHIDFPYPSAYIWALFRRVLPDIPKESAFNKDAMTWRIYELLPECQNEQGFETVAAYLGEADNPVKQFGLAHRIADSFDQYLMYRPDWVQAWEKEGAQLPHWQAKLWNRLTTDVSQPAMHRANLLHQLKHYLVSCSERPASLPGRLSIFGVSALPPVYLELYELMAKFCDITLYFLSPSESYWGNLVDPKKQGQQALQFEDLSEDSGHPLLASLGKQGQDFFEQLQQCEHESESFYIYPEHDTLLGQLQNDIFQLVDTTQLDQKRPIATEDDSFQCHACHSAMREVEVLHDQLLALFERYPNLSPTDVVVMTPDVDVYANAIDAVFGTASGDLYIPYAISGVSGQQQSPVLSSFSRLLGLAESRFDVEGILSLLECEAISNSFAINSADVPVIRDWCRETHIHWALSGEDKASLGLPRDDANSWRAGLDRMLLGYALPLTDDEGVWRLFDGQLGIDGIRGERAQLLAQLCAFVDKLEQLRKDLRQSKSAQQWQQTLLKVIATFYKPQHDNNRDQADILSISQALDSLVESAELAQFEQIIPVSLIQEWFESHAEASEQAHRFMGHGVTFCGMVPMRSIPFDVVCLIGMNDESFPRRQPKQGFDLLSYDFRKGDRSRRDDDRYLFLEAILSAKKHLYMSYIGASIVDNTAIPPSVLVSDVRDVLRQSYETTAGEDIWSVIHTEHPLQSFSRRYFNGYNAKLLSYQQASCPPSEKVSDKAWFVDSLPEPDESWRTVSLTQLMQFYRHPARYLIQQRLGLRLELEDESLECRESFELGGLEAWQVRQQVLSQRLQGEELTDIEPMIMATGILPQGLVGEKSLKAQIGQVDEFVDRLMPAYPETIFEPVPFELKLGEFNLVGLLDGFGADGLFNYRLSKLKGGELIAVWLRHLVLNLLQPEGVKLETRLITQDSDVHLLPVTAAENLLLSLLELYWQGCQSPLPLFSNTSFSFAKASLNEGKADPEKAMWASWLGGDYANAESEDSYYQQLYLNPPLDDEFKLLALELYQPIYDHLAGGRL